MIAIMVGLLGTVILPRVLKIDTMSSYSTGFVWKMFTNIQDMDSEKQKEYVDYLDEIGGTGSTEEETGCLLADKMGVYQENIRYWELLFSIMGLFG